jgi:hypothetical protein
MFRFDAVSATLNASGGTILCNCRNARSYVFASLGMAGVLVAGYDSADRAAAGNQSTQHRDPL